MIAQCEDNHTENDSQYDDDDRDSDCPIAEPDKLNNGSRS